MTRALAISVTSSLIGYSLLLLIAGPVVLLCVALICFASFVCCLAYLTRLERTPISDDEAALARADAELSRAEHEARMRRRLARQAEREASPIRGGAGGWRV